MVALCNLQSKLDGRSAVARLGISGHCAPILDLIVSNRVKGACSKCWFGRFMTLRPVSTVPDVVSPTGVKWQPYEL